MISKPAILIGGSGTLGQALLPLLLEDPMVSRVRVLSRGEHRQSEMARRIPSDRVDYMIGDVRDYDRIAYAIEGCETVMNFAAVKSVPRAEYDSLECVKTIVHGAENVIKAAKAIGVRRCMLTSTDKAAGPINCYGAAKLTAEKLWISEGNKGAGDTLFSCVRYGNVLSSQGSVLETWVRQFNTGQPVTITNPSHTRFFITPRQAARFVFTMWKGMSGGEVCVPKMKSTTIRELVEALQFSHTTIRITGDRPGEKTHESLFTEDEAPMVTDNGDHFVRWPDGDWFPCGRTGTPVAIEAYTSEHAPRFTHHELQSMIDEVRTWD